MYFIYFYLRRCNPGNYWTVLDHSNIGKATAGLIPIGCRSETFIICLLPSSVPYRLLIKKISTSRSKLFINIGIINKLMLIFKWSNPTTVIQGHKYTSQLHIKSANTLPHWNLLGLSEALQTPTCGPPTSSSRVLEACRRSSGCLYAGRLRLSCLWPPAYITTLRIAAEMKCKFICNVNITINIIFITKPSILLSLLS